MKRLQVLAMVMAVALLCGGCARKYRADEYQQVVDEVSALYQVRLTVDLGSHKGLTPEQLRAHLESVARETRLRMETT